MLTLYDTARRRKVPFEPIDPAQVRIYSCGPTIYDYAHIGNFRSFVSADVLKRYLEYRGFEVLHVMNLTDIDDRIAERVQQEGISLREFTDRFAEGFFADLQTLNVVPAKHYPRATNHIAEMLDLTQILLDKGMAYRREGSVYYSISKFPGYGEFARIDTAGMQDGARVDSDDYDKENVRDFVLWKGWTEKDGDVVWDSPFGRGRPGWHLECSAMSRKYLGEEFDIHTGGVDLVFPHHQNEIAQSEGASGKPFVRFWMHNEFLNINGTKISKSLGNHIRLKDIGSAAEIKGFRYLLATSHYRTLLNFSDAAVRSSMAAQQRLAKVRGRVREIGAVSRGPGDRLWQDRISAARKGFEEGMDDDLNSPRAIAAVFGLIHHVERHLSNGDLKPENAGAVVSFLDEINQVFGIFYEPRGEGDEKQTDLPPELIALFRRRLKAREDRKWDLADRLRDELGAAGVEVRDGREGSTWEWKRSPNRPLKNRRIPKNRKDLECRVCVAVKWTMGAIFSYIETSSKRVTEKFQTAAHSAKELKNAFTTSNPVIAVFKESRLFQQPANVPSHELV